MLHYIGLAMQFLAKVHSKQINPNRYAAEDLKKNNTLSDSVVED